MWERNPKIREIIKEISLLTFKDERVIQTVAYSPLLFVKNVMEDMFDNTPIRVRYFGVFYQKKKLTKAALMFNRFTFLTKNIDEVFESCKDIYPEFESSSELLNILKDAYENEDWESIEVVRKKYKNWRRNRDVTNP